MRYHSATTDKPKESPVMPLDNTEAIHSAFDAMSAPVRGAILATILAAALALKSNERSIAKRVTEVVAVGTTGLIAGYGMQAAGLDFGYICAGNAVIAYLGVDKIRGIVDRVIDAVLVKKGF